MPDMPESCDPAIEDCMMPMEPEVDIWEIRNMQKTYLWYTLVLGSDAFVQIIMPIILWFGAIPTSDITTSVGEAILGPGTDSGGGTTTQPNIISDATIIDSQTWTDLKTTAMDASYTSTAAYTGLSANDMSIVDALIAAQTDQGDMNTLPETPYNVVF